MSAHTPGPWNVRSHGGGQYVQHWYVSGPSVHMDTSNKAELPDMYLIAASPDLLDAAEEALEAIADGDVQSARNALRAAIAKATGETS